MKTRAVERSASLKQSAGKRSAVSPHRQSLNVKIKFLPAALPGAVHVMD